MVGTDQLIDGITSKCKHEPKRRTQIYTRVHEDGVHPMDPQEGLLTLRWCLEPMPRNSEVRSLAPTSRHSQLTTGLHPFAAMYSHWISCDAGYLVRWRYGLVSCYLSTSSINGGICTVYKFSCFMQVLEGATLDGSERQRHCFPFCTGAAFGGTPRSIASEQTRNAAQQLQPLSWLLNRTRTGPNGFCAVKHIKNTMRSAAHFACI
jgi:hypothetical protein